MDGDTEPAAQPLRSNGQSSLESYDLAKGTQVLTQKSGLWSMPALAFYVLGTWSTFVQDLASGLTNGGPVSILWGLCLVTLWNICVAVSLERCAEVCRPHSVKRTGCIVFGIREKGVQSLPCALGW